MIIRRYDLVTVVLCAAVVAVPVAAMVGAFDMQDPALEPEPVAPTSTAAIVATLPEQLTVATTPAVRGVQWTLTEPPAPPSTTLVFADDCDKASHYRIAAGLPDRFTALIWRESRCSNTAISRTGCCVGALQLHEIIFRDHRMIDRLETCDATWINVRGDTPEAWRRQMCAAKALYDVMGVGPWAL